MKNRTKIIILIVLVIILIGLVYRSMTMLKGITPSPKPAGEKKAQASSAPPATSQQTTQPATPSIPPQTMANLSLALPPRNPFIPLVSEKAPTPTKPSAPPKLPAPVIVQGQIQGQPTSAEAVKNIALSGTVVGPRSLAIIKMGEKSLIVREGEKIDGYRLRKVDRGKIIIEGAEGNLVLEGGKPE
jgi:cytoskeletal protein RodZ